MSRASESYVSAERRLRLTGEALSAHALKMAAPPSWGRHPQTFTSADKMFAFLYVLGRPAARHASANGRNTAGSIPTVAENRSIVNVGSSASTSRTSLLASS